MTTSLSGSDMNQSIHAQATIQLDQAILESFYNEIKRKVGDGNSALVRFLWYGHYRCDVSELIYYCDDISSFPPDHEEFYPYMNNLMEQPTRNELDLDEIIPVLSFMKCEPDVLMSIANLVDACKGEVVNVYSYDAQSLHGQLYKKVQNEIDMYLQRHDRSEFTEEECLQLWEVLDTDERRDEFLWEYTCLHDRVETSATIRNYVKSELHKHANSEEMKNIVELVLNNGMLFEVEECEEDY